MSRPWLLVFGAASAVMVLGVIIRLKREHIQTTVLHDEEPVLTINYSDLCPETKKEFEKLFSKAIGQALAKWFTEVCIEFEITDAVEGELWGAPRGGGGDTFFGLCFVKPSSKVAPTKKYQKVSNGHPLKYARVKAPVSRPLGVFVGGKNHRKDFFYDLATKQWKESADILSKENVAVRKAVEEALRFIQPD
jgi:hypothetical protein